MRTTNPIKAITYFENQLKARFRSFSGSSLELNRVMMSNFDKLFRDTCELILRGDSIEELRSINPEIFAESASRLRELLSTFGDRLKEVAKQLKIKNPDWTSYELNDDLVERSLERIEIISRTEIARLSSKLKKFQAEELGYQYFVWHTKKDKRVGEDHKLLEGAIFRLDDLPIQGFPQDSRPNCRCQAEFISLSESQYETVKRRQISRGIQYAN